MVIEFNVPFDCRRENTRTGKIAWRAASNSNDEPSRAYQATHCTRLMCDTERWKFLPPSVERNFVLQDTTEKIKKQPPY